MLLRRKSRTTEDEKEVGLWQSARMFSNSGRTADLSVKGQHKWMYAWMRRDGGAVVLPGRSLWSSNQQQRLGVGHIVNHLFLMSGFKKTLWKLSRWFCNTKCFQHSSSRCRMINMNTFDCRRTRIPPRSSLLYTQSLKRRNTSSVSVYVRSSSGFRNGALICT